MRATILLLLGFLVCTPAFAGVWSSLWRTPDQQGEALLAAGQPAKAARRFSNPRLKAYADLRAGRYGAAARLLAPLTDPTSEYNRGNALVHLGHLHQALAAYDAALKQAPHDADIRHNRDLVERMLAQQPPRSRNSGHGGAQRHASDKSQGRPGHGSPRNAARGASQARRSAQSGANGRGSSRPGRSGGPRTAAGKPGSRAAHGAAGEHRAQTPRARDQSGERAGTRGHSPGQARREAALAAARARSKAAHGSRQPVRAGRANGSHHAAHRLVARASGLPPKPVSEKTLALQQWLRQLPNNPAGLLRREFLIKYTLRHRGMEP